MCLDTVWQGWDHCYRFRCGQGHEWSRRSDYFALRPDCPLCLRARRYKLANFDKLREAARQRQGECLSAEYLGLRGQYRFQCINGHEWVAEGKSVLKGAWCASCRGLQLSPAPDGATRLRVSQREHLNRCRDHVFATMQKLAQAQGGSCLSEQYTGVGYYRFRCAQGHEWLMSNKQLLAGAWCRACKEAAWRERMRAAGARGAERCTPS
jgi:hypothetical protein